MDQSYMQDSVYMQPEVAPMWERQDLCLLVPSPQSDVV